MSQEASFYALPVGGDEAGITKHANGVVPEFGASEMLSKPFIKPRERRVIERIQSILNVHEQLQQYAAMVQVSIENTVIVLRGDLPSADLKRALIPAVRQAGVLGQVSNCVQVSG